MGSTRHPPFPWEVIRNLTTHTHTQEEWTGESADGERESIKKSSRPQQEMIRTYKELTSDLHPPHASPYKLEIFLTV